MSGTFDRDACVKAIHKEAMVGIPVQPVMELKDAYDDAVRDRDRYHDALVEIDTYLAHDPDLWRIVNISKIGDVLCDLLGAETVQAINASVPALLCPACGADNEPSERTETT